MVVEPVVAELVEASKRPQKKANEDGGFDKLNHRGLNHQRVYTRFALLATSE